jgi:hypothetical protein
MYPCGNGGLHRATFFDDPARAKFVPFAPFSCDSDMPDGGTRTQYPFRLAFAMTIHKAQGQTLRRVVVDIGEKERVLGMFFVALSSVKHINDQ